MSSTKTQLTIYSLSTLFLLGIFVYGYYDIRSKGQEASALTNEADVASEQDALAISIRVMKNNSKDQISSLDQFILNEEKLVPFIELIESTGKGLGLSTKTSSVSVDKVDPKKTVLLDTVHVVVETEGSWSKTVAFLHAIENLPTKVTIDSTNLRAGTTEVSVDTSTTSPRATSSKKWSMSLTLSFPSFK